MLVQKITFDLMQNKLDDIRVVQGDSCREIQFVGSDLDGVLSYDDYTYEFDLMKSDGTFVIQTLSAGILIPTEQMEVITGTHFYSVKIKDADNELIYSGQGAFIVDDNVITADAIESVAEVNGLVFPDDFYTKNDPVAQIDDDITSLSKAWSSSKISEEIGGAISTAEGYTDTVVSAIIDDNDQDTDTTWSSDKIAAEIAGATPEISDDFTLDVEKVIGTWLNGTTPLYRKVVEISGNKSVGFENVIYTLPSNCHIMMIDGCIYNDYCEGMGYPINFTYAYSGGTYAFSTWTTNAEANAVMFRNYWNSVVNKIYLILYYTKS